MCHKDDRPVAHLPGEAFQQEAFRLPVQRGGRLVQQQYPAGTEQGTGYGYALRLPLAETGALFTAKGVHAVGQGVHKVGAAA